MPTATPKPGLAFKGWTLENGDPIPDVINKNLVFKANYNPVFTITASAGAHGTITPNGSINVMSGTNQSFTIIPDAGYHIAWVNVDDLNIGQVSEYTFTNVITAHTIEA